MAKALHPETRDVRPRVLLLFGAGLLVFLTLAAVALKVIFSTTPYWPLAGAGTTSSEASPALQRSPATDLAAFRKQEDLELGKFAWVDRDAGIARIPIADAMKLIAAKGLPDWTRRATAAGQDCALLGSQVPRAPQLANCADQSPGTRPSDDQSTVPGGSGAKP
ncbi:hypothetical protein LB577_14610 [Mesorhizobium sp. B283B1A]|uniref:hypothetical protein n=1 Tax=Mesorhizobium TaxID=68287 RepID=UPI001CD0745A|nr:MULTISPECIES: hypothetical protein [Mesorhizobium]MCA0048175.1 hypothetical protein [Mesorhizobium sp. B283B1A]UQS67469.1 hypothetical protein M5D98_14560 [Mesorhizobium opportunistum]